ncbi:MAG: hypothetical protein JW384_03734 [Nitrosomonadaceae bacterium]|nr:hypothetical protein [Nitrosomonadaceae bacterium]
MKLREDEIEALLRFDRASLVVARYDALTYSAGQPYVAVIKREGGRAFAGNAESRIKAVHAVWETYQRFMDAPIQSRHNGYWLYETAVANVELQRIKNQEQRHE